MMILPAWTGTFNIAQVFPGRNSEKLRKQEKEALQAGEKTPDFVEYPQNCAGCRDKKSKMIKEQMEMYCFLDPFCKF